MRLKTTFLKKSRTIPKQKRQGLVELNHTKLSIRKQCILLDVNRSTLYYQKALESESNIELMKDIQDLYEECPFYGYRRITKVLNKESPERLNAKRVYRLMGLLGIQAIYTKPNTSKPNRHHIKYPYLLRGLKIERPNQVWCSDITYIRLNGAWVYLIAIMDIFSRAILSWSLSNTMDAGFYVSALEEALKQFGKPEIFNTDQGSQYTSLAFTSVLKENGIQISMDGVGRAIDKVYIESFWQNIKYESVYLNPVERMSAMREQLRRYVEFYNTKRPHQSFGYETPWEVYSNEGGKGSEVKTPIWPFTPKEQSCQFSKDISSEESHNHNMIWIAESALKKSG